MFHPLRNAAVVLLALLFTGQVRAQERYYLIMFGAQRPGISNPKYTHTFAVFAKVTGELPQLRCPEAGNRAGTRLLLLLRSMGVRLDFPTPDRSGGLL